MVMRSLSLSTPYPYPLLILVHSLSLLTQLPCDVIVLNIHGQQWQIEQQLISINYSLPFYFLLPPCKLATRHPLVPPGLQAKSPAIFIFKEQVPHFNVRPIVTLLSYGECSVAILLYQSNKTDYPNISKGCTIGYCFCETYLCGILHYAFLSFPLKITGDHTESQILLGLELYKLRYGYIYELLFSMANFHSPLVDTERGLEV